MVFTEIGRIEDEDSGFGLLISLGTETVADKRVNIDTGGCGSWRGHYFAETTEKRAYYRSDEYGNGNLGS